MRSQLKPVTFACAMLSCAAIVAGLLVAAAVVVPTPAEADKVVLCSGVTKAEVAACDQSDWADHMANSYWSMYAGHNCTNYVAYRESMNGVPTPTIRLHNANQWATNAAKLGYTVNATPAKGAAGVFGTYNHVVYIDGVGNGYLLISEDNYPGYYPKGMYRRLKVYPGDSLYPKQFIHFEAAAGTVATTTPVNEGDFITYQKSTYRVVGNAPVYVSSWDGFGGAQTTKAVTAAQWKALGQYPADGTYLRTTDGDVYRMSGGAPMYVSGWDAVGGKPSTTPLTVDAAAVTNAGGLGVWGHLLKVPADGTYLRTATGTTYRIAGGAPMYVSGWDAVGGKPAATTNITTVDAADIDNAGGTGRWAHLLADPANGTYLQGGTSRTIYRVAGGAPLPVGSWSRVGGAAAATVVDDSTIAAAGGSGRLGHLSAEPADGTIIRGYTTKTVYVVAGGAPVKVTKWSNIGGEKPAVDVDQTVIARAGSTGAYSHLKALATDVFLQGGRTKRIVRVNEQGYAWRISSWAPYGGAQPTVTVDDQAINSCDRVDCSPFGALEDTEPLRTRVTVTGWTQDPNTTAPIDVRVLVDGVRSATATASLTRTDVDAIYHRGTRFGYVVTAPATAGVHRVCVTAVNTGAGSDASLGCETVTVLPRLTPTLAVGGETSSKAGAATVTATVSAPGVPQAGGTVTVNWGDEVLARGVPLVNGTVAVPVHGLPRGSRTLTVTYSGTADIDTTVASRRVQVR